jgi:hypothetical protein
VAQISARLGEGGGRVLLVNEEQPVELGYEH